MSGLDDQKFRSPRAALRASGLAACVVASTLLAIGCTASGQSSSPANAALVGPSSGSTTTAPPPTTSSPSIPTTTTTPTTVRPPVTTTTVPGPSGPRSGSSGPAVVQLQQSLSALGYWLGAPDGAYGTTTTQAVVALQKAAGLRRTGVFDAATAAALAAGVKPKPQSTSGHVIEVDLAHQLLLLVTNGHLDATLNTSTGGGYKYYSQGVTSVAITPLGHFTTSWEVNGTRVSPLGVLWRPKFFVGGIAIHGDSSVPSYPASHGCVRVSNEAINWIWDTGADPIGTSVWVR